jgi:hypothetical protein
VRIKGSASHAWRAASIFFLAILASSNALTIENESPGSPERSPVSVMVSKTRDPVVKFATWELARYLGLITGETVPVNASSAEHHIDIGFVPPRVSKAAQSALSISLGDLKEDGFIIRTLGPDIVILGKGGRGDLYGCYAFLETLGARWFFPGSEYEVVPRHKIRWDKPLNISESPSFPVRILFYWPNNYSSIEDWIDYAAKARLNRIAFHYTWPARDWYIDLRQQLQPELAERGMEIEVGGHFLSSFLPRDLFKQHPDWFRRNRRGQRVSDFNFDPFNSQALAYITSHAINYLLLMPGAELYHLWPDDIEGGGWTHDPGKEQYTPSDQSLLVANDVITRLRRRLPDAHLSFLAYHDTVYPPKIVKPAKGIVYFYAPRERCYAHALNDPQCPLNQRYSLALEHALPAFGAAHAEVFEYYVDEILYENLQPPLPEVLQQDAQYYHQLGIPALGALMTNTGEFQTPMVNMYLYPQVLWNDHADLRESLRDYARVYFGDPAIDSYFESLSSGLNDVLKTCDYKHPGDAWDSLELKNESVEALGDHVRGIREGIEGPLTEAGMLLNAALSRAGSGVFRRRLEKENRQMDFTLLQTRLFYHLLNGEWLYREYKERGDPEAGLRAVTEYVLAHRTRQRMWEYMGHANLKGEPLLPSAAPLHDEVGHLVDGAFSVDPLAEQLLSGVSGSIVSGPQGSEAILWTDVAPSAQGFRAGSSDVKWEDEFGNQLSADTIKLANFPVLVEARGVPADKLFDVLLTAQRKPYATRRGRR